MRDAPARDGSGDAAWRAAYGELLAREGPCPSGDELAGLAVGALAVAERERLADHVVGCAACAQGLCDLMQLHGQAERLRARAPGPPRSGWSWAPIGVAAALIVAALAVDVAYRPTAPEAEGLPAPTRAGTGGRIEARAPGAVPARSPVVLRWELVPPTPGAKFDLTVSDERLEALGGAEGLGAAEFAVPAAWLERVPAGSTVLWRVDAILPDGARVRGETFTLRLE